MSLARPVAAAATAERFFEVGGRKAPRVGHTAGVAVEGDGEDPQGGKREGGDQQDRRDREPFVGRKVICARYRRVRMASDPAKRSKAERRADVALVISYHEARLGELLERVRDGFKHYDAGELDAFELDELIHRYKKAARELWKFCGDISGRSAHFTARTLEEMQHRGETIDWWERGNPERNKN